METRAKNGKNHPNLGFTAWMVVIWAMAGGILLGGVYVAFLTATSRLSTSGQIPIMTLFFATGALLGVLHGGLLGYLGRPQELDHVDALKGIGFGILGSVPGLGIAWVLTLWVGITASAGAADGLLPMAGVAAGWIGGMAIFAWAFRWGWDAARNLVAHWADARLGGSLLAGTFLLLSAVFVVAKPEIWWTDVRVTRTGAILLALGATVWIAGPLVLLTLKLLHRRGSNQEVEIL